MGKIDQPQDFFNGSLKFVWEPVFSSNIEEKLHAAQVYVDKAVIDKMIPYTPRRNGILENSVKPFTVIGSGRIVQSTPYARYLYYGEVYAPNIPIIKGGELVGFWSPPHKHPTGRALKYDTSRHPLAGSHWFERMKADKKEEIRRGAQAILGGKVTEK